MFSKPSLRVDILLFLKAQSVKTHIVASLMLMGIMLQPPTMPSTSASAQVNASPLWDCDEHRYYIDASGTYRPASGFYRILQSTSPIDECVAAWKVRLNAIASKESIGGQICAADPPTPAQNPLYPTRFGPTGLMIFDMYKSAIRCNTGVPIEVALTIGLEHSLARQLKQVGCQTPS